MVVLTGRLARQGWAWAAGPRRTEDLPALVAHFVQRSSRHIGKSVLGASPQALALLKSHGWPGNIRELQNAVERAVVVAREEWLQPEDFALVAQAREPLGIGDPTLPPSEVERRHIEHVLNENRWNISQSARVLGVDRATLYNKIKRYGFTPPHA